MRGACLVRAFVGGFAAKFFLWIGQFRWGVGGGAEVRHACKTGVVWGVGFKVVGFQGVHDKPVPTSLQGFGNGFAAMLEDFGG